MNRKEKINLIEHLLLCTGDAHATYQQKVLEGNPDLEWAEWYAEYLIGHGLDNILGDVMAVDKITSFLEETEKETRARPIGVPWRRLAAARMARINERSPA